MKIHALRLAAVLALLGAVACLDDVTGTRPASISLTASSSTVMVDDTVTISFSAQGTGLAQVNIAFGDGDEEIKSYTGPVTVTDFTRHSYSAAGSYDVIAEVLTAAGNASDTLTITVN